MLTNPHIALVDDHTLFADGFRALLSQSGEDYSVTAFHRGSALLEAISDGQVFDLFVLDLVMRDMNGLALLAAIRKLKEDARVLMLSGIAGEPPLTEMRQLGANGFVHKSTDMDALLAAVNCLINGEDLDWGMDVRPYESGAENLDRFPDRAAIPKLGPRQIEVVGLIAQGRTNREIAEQLTISENTVKSHTRAIFEALGVRTRTACVRKAQELGLI